MFVNGKYGFYSELDEIKRMKWEGPDDHKTHLIVVFGVWQKEM